MRISSRTSILMASAVAFYLLLSIQSSFSQNHVSTYAGTGSVGFVNGDTSIASFNKPFGICIDAIGNVYLADAHNHCIRKIAVDGQVSTYAGTGSAGYLDGPAAEAQFNQPLNICFDDNGNMYVSDFINQRIRKISADMQVTTIAGTGVPGHVNGAAAEAQFNYPRGICLDDTGNIYIGDSWNHRIRKISIQGVVSDWAGGGSVIGVQSVGDYVDASDTAARFYTPCELSIDANNNIFVADAYNHRIRKIDANRMVTTVAGSGGHGPNGGGFQNGPGSEAEFDTPTTVFVSVQGNLFVGDGANQVMRKIDTALMVSTFAGSGNAGFENGIDSLAQFNFPRGSVMDNTLNRLYVVDYYNHAVRIIHIATSVGLSENSVHPLNLQVGPNPFSSETTFRYHLQDNSKVSIYINNPTGALISAFNREKTAGKHQWTWNANNLPGGIYLYTFSVNGVKEHGKLVVE